MAFAVILILNVVLFFNQSAMAFESAQDFAELQNLKSFKLVCTDRAVYSDQEQLLQAAKGDFFETHFILHWKEGQIQDSQLVLIKPTRFVENYFFPHAELSHLSKMQFSNAGLNVEIDNQSYYYPIDLRLTLNSQSLDQFGGLFAGQLDFDDRDGFSLSRSVFCRANY